MKNYLQYLRSILRIAMGWVFLWAFLDKLFGLNFATEASKSWLNGNSPTMGFLKFGTTGPFSDIFQAMAGNIVVDWLFMLGLLLIGVALIFGIAMKLATIGGTIMMLLMFLAVLLPEHNPLIDEHIIYALVLISLYLNNAGHVWGLGKNWSQSSLVKKYSILK